MDRTKIKIEPMQVFWGDDVMQVDQIVIPADAAGSMNNKYFFLYLPDGTRRHVWFNINSAGTDPAPANSTGIEVDGATGATGTALAGAAATAIALIIGFGASHSGAALTVTRTDAGYCIPCHVGVGTFTFLLVTEGDAEEDVGYTDGNIEVTPGETSDDIESHQTGKTKLGKIQTGFNMKTKITFKETSSAQMRRVLLKQGAAYMPAGANATQLMGYGSSKQFISNASRQRGLRLHPVVLQDSDHSRDVNFWKADPVLSKLDFSGDKVLLLPIDFEIFQDPSKPKEINLFAIGDASQLT